MVDPEPAGSKLAPDLSQSMFLCLQFLRVQGQATKNTPLQEDDWCFTQRSWPVSSFVEEL